MAFKAKYAGRCANGDRIAQDELVEYTEDGELVHVDCDETEAPEVARGEVCMGCFLEKPLSGGCPNCD